MTSWNDRFCGVWKAINYVKVGGTQIYKVSFVGGVLYSNISKEPLYCSMPESKNSEIKQFSVLDDSI